MADLVNKKVKHSVKYGEGTVIEQDDTSITVEFPSKTCKFQYPAAFENFLTVEDSSLVDVVNTELKEFKEAEEAAKAAEAAKKAAEEQAKIEALKAKAASSGKKTGDTKAYKPVKRVAGQALTYLVFQGDTYDEEVSGEFIWAPKFSKDGKTMHHWERLMDVRKGDVIFHCAGGQIKAISRAKGACIDCPKPSQDSGESSNWENAGRKVQLEYNVLNTPIKHGDY